MKHLLLTTIAAVVLVGCGPKAPDISIQEAAEEGNIEAVKQHLAAGTDVNEYSIGEDSALYLASFEGHFEIVELLLANGADVNLGFKGMGQIIPVSPLDISTSFDYPKISDLLRKNGGKHASIHGAAEGGDIDSVKDFLASGVDVDAVDAYKQTALHVAKTMEIAELLLSKGADVNFKSNLGTPLFNHKYGDNNKEIIDLLKKNGGKTQWELEAEGK
jgi:ankyrin repeat protein